jgi:hypothetical protein
MSFTVTNIDPILSDDIKKVEFWLPYLLLPHY